MRNQGLQQGYDALSTNFGQGRDAATAQYGDAKNIYAGLGDYFKTNYGGGASAYGDATGANGAEGTARARTNFTADPGYGFQLDQGLQALQRTHAAAGNLASGNADADTLKFSQGLADQSYGNYVKRLEPYLGLTAGGVTTAATGTATADQHLGNTLDASYRGQGTAANANYTGQGASNAAAEMNNYNIGQNQLNALVSAGKLGASLFGGFG